MELIGGLFEKFKGRFAGQIRNYEIIIQTIEKSTGVKVEMKDISISAGVLRLKGSAVFKNVLYIKKSQILKEINQKAVNLTLSDIA